MKTIGLTGGIASGKSTIAKNLEKLGAILINADEISHRIIEPDTPAWNEIVQTFGQEILQKNSFINRKMLGSIVFGNPEKLQVLNQITHPRIMAQIKKEFEAIRQSQSNAVVVMEIPLLYETHMEKMFDQVWVVWIDHETQIRRLMERDGINREEALQRIESQMPLDEKAKRADLIIDNSNNIEETIENVTTYFNNILSNSKI